MWNRQKSLKDKHLEQQAKIEAEREAQLKEKKVEKELEKKDKE